MSRRISRQISAAVGYSAEELRNADQERQCERADEALRARLTMSDDGGKADLAPGCIEVRK